MSSSVPVNEIDDATNSLRIHALGDLHGWAPGLIIYLTRNNLAKIEISGVKVYDESSKGIISLNVDAMCRLFPDLKEHIESSKEDSIDTANTLESFHHAGLLGQRAGKLNHKASYCEIQADWIGENEYFIQVGDIFDRADHSELAAEIIRQLIIQAPAHIFALVGNHEEFLLLDQHSGWYRNEVKWEYDADKGGNTRTMELINEGSTKEDLLNDTYEKYRQSASMLYLTQFFAKRKVTKNGNLDIPFLSKADINSYSEKILSGGWLGYEAASDLDKLILENAKKGSIRYPGAIAGLGLGNTWFMHGEPNGLKKYFSSLNEKSVDILKTPINVGNRDMLILEMDVIASKDDGYKSDCTELFWARDAHSGFEGIDSKFAHITEPIIKILPGVRNIVHGHSPVPNILMENKPHTYLGRIVGKNVSPTSGEIRVYNIDEGITPVYQIIMNNEEKMKCSPTGLQVPNALKEIHDSGELIGEAQIWDLAHMFIEKEDSPFTISRDLTLNEMPKQYLKEGPGQIKINPENYLEPEFTCTTEDEFRSDPSKYSWINIKEFEKLSNPNKSKTPPADKLYRVQHEEQGTLTLAQNVLKMLELESFNQPFKRKIIEAYSGDRSIEYLKKIRTKEYFTPILKKYGVLAEAINSQICFINLRATTTDNFLNLSFLNMRHNPITLKVENCNLDSGSTIKKNEFTSIFKIKAGSYLTTKVKVINSTSPIRVFLEYKDGNTRNVFEGIFGLGKDEVITEETQNKPPCILVKTLMRNINHPLYEFTKKSQTKKEVVKNILDDETVRQNNHPSKDTSGITKSDTSRPTTGSQPTEPPSNPPPNDLETADKILKRHNKTDGINNVGSSENQSEM
jgi:hypothetical protein